MSPNTLCRSPVSPSRWSGHTHTRNHLSPRGENHRPVHDGVSRQCHILAPTMEPANEPLETKFRMGQGPGHAEGWETSAVLPVGVRFTVTTAGAYTVVTEVDGAAMQVSVRFLDAPPA